MHASLLTLLLFLSSNSFAPSLPYHTTHTHHKHVRPKGLPVESTLFLLFRFSSLVSCLVSPIKSYTTNAYFLLFLVYALANTFSFFFSAGAAAPFVPEAWA